MKKITLGILAHVDSGKTTLSESLLYLTGEVRNPGRVDHKNAFLDTFNLERERGITIFSKQAVMHAENSVITLLDTPGHVDFSAEAERVLSVLDYAVLVISATDGVQSHTETLWSLLKRYSVPVFIFVNKMDIAQKDAKELMSELKQKLSDNCIDFSNDNFSEEVLDELSLCSEGLMNEFLENASVTDGEIKEAIFSRQLFPCFFGSALKHDRTKSLLDGILKYTKEIKYPQKFAAKVYKISDDGKGARLTHLKITGGKLSVRDEITGGQNEKWSEKVTGIRIYSGEKFEQADIAESGTVCAVTGLSKTFAGEGLGEEINAVSPILEPVLTYKVIFPKEINTPDALSKIRILEEEEPLLKVIYKEATAEICVCLMGEVQLEILKSLIKDRFGIDVSFGEGTISYKETIEEKMLGIGHFEPLRHYAEVHLLLEPLERGSGLKFESTCSLDSLDRNWQRLIFTHLKEKMHVGVLTGSPITDMKISLVAGRAHKKHTEGGDFRQATYRAVRQGLMRAKCVLLEPRYDFKLSVPQENVGRALNDLSLMSARFSSPEITGDMAVISGNASVREMQSYQSEVISYTSGRGKLFCVLSGYEKCENSEKIIEEIGYNPESDLENTPDSVFCAHGAGFTVKWDEVMDYANIETDFKTEEEILALAQENAKKAEEYVKRAASDKELMAIFERTYGEIKRPEFAAMKKVKTEVEIPERYKKTPKVKKYDKDYLLVDGYNIIFAWSELKDIARSDLEGARGRLIDILCNYQGFAGCELIAVFDAYKVKNNPGTVEKINNINVVYTKEAETADMYIEKVSRVLSANNRVRVATSDSLEQLIILGGGALRLSAENFKKEVDAAEAAIRQAISN